MESAANFVTLFENQKSIRIVFVILNIFAWFADDSDEKNLLSNKKETDKLAQNIYTIIIIISLLINFYYLIVNEKQYQEAIQKNKNVKEFKLRNIAIIIVIISLIIFLYVQLNDEDISLDETIGIQ